VLRSSLATFWASAWALPAGTSPRSRSPTVSSTAALIVDTFCGPPGWRHLGADVSRGCDRDNDAKKSIPRACLSDAPDQRAAPWLAASAALASRRAWTSGLLVFDAFASPSDAFASHRSREIVAWLHPSSFSRPGFPARLDLRVVGFCSIWNNFPF